MTSPPARQRFYQEIHQPEAQIDLARAALYIAQEEYPDLDPEDYLAALDTMADELRDRLPSELYPLRVLKTINEYLYTDLGYKGNATHYYDPRNSFLNDVIERRTGIPITLSLVYLELAHRIDFPMVGIGMPGHFLIRPDFEESGIFVDAFHQGEILFAEECQERLTQVYGPSTQLQPQFLEPIRARQFLARMLTNLKSIYLSQADLPKGLAAIERLLLLSPYSLMELRDRGLVYYQMRRWREAQQDLEVYLTGLETTEARESSDTLVIRHLLERMERDIDSLS